MISGIFLGSKGVGGAVRPGSAKEMLKTIKMTHDQCIFFTFDRFCLRKSAMENP